MYDDTGEQGTVLVVYSSIDALVPPDYYSLSP